MSEPMSSTPRQSSDKTLASVHSMTVDDTTEVKPPVAVAAPESTVVTGKKLAVIFVAMCVYLSIVHFLRFTYFFLFRQVVVASVNRPGSNHLVCVYST